jgi:hypothetical protein
MPLLRIAIHPLRFCLLLALVSLICQPVLAQSDQRSDLEPAFAAINQKSVTATISFLASDEMAGRNTPSRELDIASAYVAARFRGAGLAGGGDNGSFFQTTSLATVQLPGSGINLQQDGQPVQNFGLLAGAEDNFVFDGKIAVVNIEDYRDKKFSGPVYLAPGDLSDRRAMFNLARQTAVLKNNGATLILIPVEEGNPLIDSAKQLQEPALVRTRGFAGPTLLVSKLNPDSQFHIEIPKMSGSEASVHNTIGVLKGSDPTLQNEAVIFSAHLDHLGHTTGTGDTIYNGADDDASGVTAVLTLADAFAALATPPRRTVIFMTFWGEEKGLLGSRYFVSHPTWPLEDIVANINIEMIGRPEPGANAKCWVTGWNESDLGELMSQGSNSVDVLIFEHPKYSGMLYRASDNYPFVEKGVIAHSFSAGSLHSDYHQVTDEWEKLEIKHMTQVIKGLFAGSLPIANGEVTPHRTGK